MHKLKRFLPKHFLLRWMLIHTIVIALGIILSSWAIYHTACFLVEGMGSFNGHGQQRFSSTLFQYLLIFCLVSIIGGSLLNYYFAKRLLRPIQTLIFSTKKMKQGLYPEEVMETTTDGEIGELVEHYNELIQQLKNNEVYRKKMISNLSHEFRTPLANLTGYLHALENGVIEGDKHLYASLQKESNRLMKMVEQLEQLKEWDYETSIKVSNKQYVDIREELKQCTHMFEQRIKKANIEIEVDIKPRTIMVQVEGFHQVMSNLMDNAIVYNTGHGPIVVKGEVVDGNYLVSITGPSEKIPSSAEERLFDRLYRVDDSRSQHSGGRGLGLAIAKEIVERHKGEIGYCRLDEELNCFYFTLPLSLK